MEGVQALLPQGAIPPKPRVYLRQRFRTQAVHAPLRVLRHIHKPCLAQHAQVARDTGPGNRKQVSQLADRRWMISEHLKYRPPAFVGQCV